MTTVPARRLFLNRMLSKLQEQYSDEIEIIVCEDDYLLSVGEKRNILIDVATGKYLSFIDDDDMISDDYVSEIIAVMRDNPDTTYISFIQEYYDNGIKGKPFFVLLKHYPWRETEAGYYRDIGHICPILTIIAKQFKYRSMDFGEDYWWSVAIRESGLLRQEENMFIEKPLYQYKFFHGVSLTHGAIGENIEKETGLYKNKNIIKWDKVEIKIPIKYMRITTNWVKEF